MIEMNQYKHITDRYTHIKINGKWIPCSCDTDEECKVHCVETIPPREGKDE